jgi:hypothetical protein
VRDYSSREEEEDLALGLYKLNYVRSRSAGGSPGIVFLEASHPTRLCYYEMP